MYQYTPFPEILQAPVKKIHSRKRARSKMNGPSAFPANPG